MKNVVIGVCSCALIGILILTVYTLHGRSIRQEELNQALTSGMKNAVERMREETIYTDSDDRELIALFLQEFLTQINSNSQVTVHILDVDYEKGLLSAEAVLTYLHPIGKTGAVSSRQTVLVENYGKKQTPAYCSIEYIVNGSSYKCYHVQKGSNIITPGAPYMEGKSFVGWREEAGSEIVSLVGKTAEEDCMFVAVFQ